MVTKLGFFFFFPSSRKGNAPCWNLPEYFKIIVYKENLPENYDPQQKGITEMQSITRNTDYT